MGISTTYQDIVKAAVNAQYNHEFFGMPHARAGIDKESDSRRLCTIVKRLNFQFAMAMHQYGHKQAIIEPDSEVVTEEPELEAEYQNFASRPLQITRSEAINQAHGMLIRSRGHELPGTFSSALVNDLFWEQASKWPKIAACHIINVMRFRHHLMDMAVDYAAPEDVADRLKAGKVRSATYHRFDAAQADFKRIVNDMHQNPITYDPSYTAIVQKMRRDKQKAKSESLARQAEMNVHNANFDHQNEPAQVRDGMIEPDMDKTSAEDALDCSQAYYKVSVISKLCLLISCLWLLTPVCFSFRRRLSTSSRSSSSK